MDREILERILDGREKPTNLSLALLKNITNNFSEDREIGYGGFATIYKGVLPNGNVAVKRIRNNHIPVNETFFCREVDSLLNIKHKNVVRFLGFCASTDQTAIQIEGSKKHIYAEVRERLLCFEYISNGSLQKYIVDELRGLEWNTRYGIIRGICEGLLHLHQKGIHHMDLKPDNILLDTDMVPKITDFGLSRLEQKSSTMSANRHGSPGYCAPEYLHRGQISFKSDMYGLGVIIIELVTGEKATPNNTTNNILRRWRHRWKKTGKETPLVYQQVAKCIEIGSLCQENDPSKRPYIWDMIRVIREIEGANGKISNACEHTSGQISPYSEDDMLGIEPLELCFHVQLNKHILCALELTNETDSCIAFFVQYMRPMLYCTQPQKGIIPARSKRNIEITLQPQGEAPRDTHRANEFKVWSTKVNDGLAIEDISLFFLWNDWLAIEDVSKTLSIKEAVNVVDEVNLDVVFEATEPQEASDKTNKGFSFLRYGPVPDGPTSPPRALLPLSRSRRHWICSPSPTPSTSSPKHTIPSLLQILDDAAGLICSIDVNQTEPLIITGGSCGLIQIWNYDTQKMISSINVSEIGAVHAKFIARKGWVVALSYNCIIHVYKYEKKMQEVTCFRAHNHPGAICPLAVHPTQPYVLSGCHMQIKLWDWDQGWNCIQTFQEHSRTVCYVTFNPEDTNSFASASADYTVKVWSLDSPKCKYTLYGHSNTVNCLDFFTRDGKQYLISTSYDETAKIWDMEKKECLHTLGNVDMSPFCFVISHPNLPVLITGTLDGTIHVWSSTNFSLKAILDNTGREWVTGFACLMGTGRVVVAHVLGLSVIDIHDEEQGGSGGSNEKSISATD